MSARKAKRQAPVHESGSDDPSYIRKQLALACDQLAIALTTASQAEDLEMVDQIVPVMATLWSTRMELNSIGGET